MKVKRGKVGKAIRELRRMDEFEAVSVVTGHCDIIGIVDVADIETLTKLVADRIRTLEGIIRTETLICLSVS
jgi:DNA-binding Lrp family transcriptional regulator